MITDYYNFSSCLTPLIAGISSTFVLWVFVSVLYYSTVFNLHHPKTEGYTKHQAVYTVTLERNIVYIQPPQQAGCGQEKVLANLSTKNRYPNHKDIWDRDCVWPIVIRRTTSDVMRLHSGRINQFIGNMLYKEVLSLQTAFLLSKMFSRDYKILIHIEISPLRSFYLLLI